jgi:hypothetical protein
MPDSIHAARWINQACGRGWDVHLFPAYEATPRPELRDVTVHTYFRRRPAGIDPSVRVRGVWPTRRGAHRLEVLIDRLRPGWSGRASRLARLIGRLKPDVVHSLEMQHAGYLTLDAKRLSPGGAFPPWVCSNWGSDIYLYGRLPGHAERIRAVLGACDYYHCECHRDVALARDYGFRGEVLGVVPGGAGFDLEQARRLREPGPTSARRHIVLKGNQDGKGRALFGLRALELCADALRGYRLAIYFAEPHMAVAAELFAQDTGLPVELLRPGRPHEEILRLHGRARASIGLSISDAASTSAFEAMVMGSLPIQSNTSCLGEWARAGETALLVHPHDPEGIAAAVRRAVTDDGLVDRAAEENARVAARRLDRSVIEPQVVAMYERIAARKKHKADGSRGAAGGAR